MIISNRALFCVLCYVFVRTYVHVLQKEETKGTSVKKAAILNELNAVNKLRENLVVKQHEPLTLFRMGFFGAAHGWGGAFLAPLPKIRRTYPTVMKLGTVILYPRKI